ncbi:PAS domain S-box protein, partial [Anabaena sp. UHCC 0253]|uniref:PAS domain S-box protein n=1 Tax=Anabaena sp. UHCC 0253 TaxID=2590019 RepID=UPI001445D7B0
MSLISLIEADNLEQAIASLAAGITHNPLIVTPDTPVTEAIALMSHARATCKLENINPDQNYLLIDARASCVLVMEKDQLVGIFTKRDVVHLSAAGQQIGEMVIADVMTSSVVTIRESEFNDLFTVLNIFRRNRIRHLPILDDNNQLLGLITHENLRQLLRPIDLLKLRLVSEVMNIRLVHATPETSILEVTKLMTRNNVSSVVIIEEQNYLPIPIGIITEQDIVQFQALDLDLESISVAKVMSSPVFSVSPDQSLWSIFMLMKERRIHRVVVTGEQGEMLGFVTYTTILQALNPLDIYKIVQILEQKVSQLETEKLDLLQNRNAELEQEVKKRTAELQEQTERERLLSAIANRIRVSLDLEEILNSLAIEVRKLLNCDRVLVYQLYPSGNGMVIAEDIKSGWLSFQGEEIFDPCFAQDWIEPYIQGRIQVVEDIYTAGMTPCHWQLLERLQIRAKIIVPIVVGKRLWGLMLTCQNDAPRIWQPEETELLQQLATHVSIAIQQAELYHRLQSELQERRRTEIALSKSEEMYRTTLNNISDAVFITDDQGQFTFICPNIDVLFGYSPADIIQMGSIHNLLGGTLFAPEDLAISGEVTNIERQIYDQKGIQHIVLVNIKKVQIGEGTLLYSCRNISDRKRMEQKLKDSEERLRTIVETSASGFVTVNMQGQILFVNPTAARMFGRNIPELQGWPFALPYDCDSHQVQEIEILQPEGQRRKVNMQPASIPWNGEKAFLMSLSDITELKQTEELLRQSEGNYRLLNEELEARVQQRTIDLQLAQEQLKASEAMLQLVLDTIPQRVFWKDRQSVILGCNRNFAEDVGCTPEEIVGKASHEISATSEEIEYYIECDRLVINNGEPQLHIQETLHKADGSCIWLETNKVPLRDFDGNIIGILGTYEDITTRRTAEEALRYSEERFRIALNNSPIVVFNQDIDLRYTWIYNPAFGLEVADVIGKFDDDILLPKDAQKLTSWKRHVLSTGQSMREEIVIGEEDDFICYVLTIHPLRDRNGNIEGITCAALDITDRKKVELALKDSQYLIQRITEASPDILYIYDLHEQRNVYINREIARLIGYSAQEIQDMGNELFVHIMHPDDLIRISEYHAALITASDEEIREIEYRMCDRQGNWYWFLSHDTVFSRDNNNLPKQIIGAASEITERKQMEAQLRQTNAELARATRLKSEFLANMSHELRTPLNAILGMSEGLQEGVFGTINHLQKRAVETIERSGKHLLELINDILDLSKIEAGKLELQLATVSCSSLCESSVIFVKQQALKKNIEISVEVPIYLPNIIVDERRFLQVLINLLNNAVKFTHDGGKIQLLVEQVEAGDSKEGKREEIIEDSSALPPFSQWICFSIIDNGIGIDGANLDKLFQPFVQIDSSLNRQYNGTGLGLSLVRQLVKLHGGKITVASKIDTGSCFQVYIPYTGELINQNFCWQMEHRSKQLLHSQYLFILSLTL